MAISCGVSGIYAGFDPKKGPVFRYEKKGERIMADMKCCLHIFGSRGNQFNQCLDCTTFYQILTLPLDWLEKVYTLIFPPKSRYVRVVWTSPMSESSGGQ